ncbi:neutral amino acid permease [Calycina marina]|uniref:Neutral amino acid permease n=1 Tax=Calycina marina TaxID=1763456 RepID=A0A9P7YWM3_9HELO|nr:neutral amino acid permease [Calycina marina]
MAMNNDRSSTDEAKKIQLDEKLGNDRNIDAEGGQRSKYGASNGATGGRIAPVLGHLQGYDFGDDSGSDILGKQIEMEADNAIKYRTCSWQKTAALLFSEYICLAIMSFPYSYSVLGLVPGLILTVAVAAVVLYTSLVVWEFCVRHPEVRDVCDIGQMLFFGKKWVWYATAVMFILNNCFIQGLHVLVTAKYLNTITSHSQCTVVFSIIAAIVCWFCSLPRTFSTLSKLATASAFFTFVSVFLAAVFSGVESHPFGYTLDPNATDLTTGLALPNGEPIVTAIPVEGVTFVAGMNAFLNIAYTFIGQITLPSFIAEMENPKDFPKALWAITICEVIVFSVVGGVVYGFTGNQYMTAPAFGSLGNEVFKKVSFSFMIPTLIFLGVLYASVSARFIFFRIFEGTRHKTSHTVVGWAAWGGILAATWLAAFVIAEVIPFFSDLLALMSSLFDSFFGFIFWGVAYIRMRRVDGQYTGLIHPKTPYGYSMFGLNVAIICTGCFFLSAGTYTSVQSIIDGYEAGSFSGPFTCASNGI